MFKLPYLNNKWRNAHDMILDAQIGIVKVEQIDLENIINSRKFDIITRLEAIICLVKLYKSDVDSVFDKISDVPKSYMKNSYMEIAKYIANPSMDRFFSIVKDIDFENSIKFHIYTERLSVFLQPMHQIIMKYILLSMCKKNSKLLNEKSKNDSIPAALENIEAVNPEVFLINNDYNSWLF